MTWLTQHPLFDAFILGLLVALNPCQLAINVSALTFLSKRSAHHRELMRKGWVLAIGKGVTYTLLGWVAVFFLRQSAQLEFFQHILSYGEAFLPYALFALALFLIARALWSHHHHGGECHHCDETIRGKGHLGAFVLGLTLALAFCPESALLYFGMTLPLGIDSGSVAISLLIPALFAVGAMLPVAVMAYVMAVAKREALHLSHHMHHFQRVLNLIVACLFVVAGIIMLCS